MKVTHRRLFSLLLLMTFVLCACGNKHEAQYHGDTLYLDGEWYIGSDALYKESNTKICKTEDGATLYEVEGDKEHNYVVCRVLWDAGLFVKESYTPDRTTISALCFGRSRDYISDEAVINCVLSLESNEGIHYDSEEHEDSRMKGTRIYVKYKDEAVGEYLGDIFVYSDQYMYYNHNKWWIARMLTDEQIELLQEYL